MEKPLPPPKKSFFLPNLMICSSSVLIVNQSLGSPHTGAKSSFGDRIWGEAEITADSDCSHEVKRCLLPGRKIMTNLDSILKSKDNHFADKGRYGQSYGFSSSHVRMWELEHKKDCQLSRVRIFATPWTAAHQASLSITNSRSSLKFMSIESVMPSISSSVVPFSSRPQSFPASGSFQMS